ncbi:hypothetical protein Dimus_021506 [Dionaea muscipula]
MFYSQFILAKKGPLGTIWIAAHLERKLRKNQVADTDIGVSVDSILFPEVPIALRLSSHLLLGVVRIYSRKVNYLFDDCSEALLKVKQAFSSAAVDLPPEESKAPYHSITLPETFDLDDFELPDNDIVLGNHVDHHVSAKEHITLQDPMDGVVFSTSQFGLDERFGDGDTSQIGLDLEEELLFDKGATSGHGDILDSSTIVEPNVEPSSLFEGAENDEEIYDSPVATTVKCLNIQAPSTPGLMEEPYLPSAQDTLVSDDHMDEDQNSTELGAKELIGAASGQSEAYPVDSDTVLPPPKENGQLHDHQDDERDTKQEFLPSADEMMEVVVPDHTQLSFANGTSLLKGSEESPSFQIGIPTGNEPAAAFGFPFKEVHGDGYLQGGAHTCTDYESPFHQAAGAALDLRAFDTHIDNFPSKSHASGFCSSISDRIAYNDKPKPEHEVLHVEVDKNLQDSTCQVGDTETPACPKPEHPGAHGNLSMDSVPVILACNSHEGSAQETLFSASKPVLQASNLYVNDANAQPQDMVCAPCQPSFDVGLSALGASGREDAPNIYVASTVVQEPVQPTMVSDQMRYPACFSCTGADHSNLDGQVSSLVSSDSPTRKENSAPVPDLPSPEKLLSVPDTGRSNELFVDSTPAKEILAEGDGDSAVNVLSGKKRSLTESTVTFQSITSVESFAGYQSKNSVEFIPNDDDLLSSILAGRRSTVLRVKPTPPVQDVESMKRRRLTPRTTPYKRKLLVDDNMVLHGDTIRQQLINTEDIRRLRKKAPCTRSEIWRLQKHLLEDKVFSEPLFSGMSAELISLYSRAFDISGIRIVRDEAHAADFSEPNQMDSCTRPGDKEAGNDGKNLESVARDVIGKQHAEEIVNQQSANDSLILDHNSTENEKTFLEHGHGNSRQDTSGMTTAIENEGRGIPAGGGLDHSVNLGDKLPSIGSVSFENGTSTDVAIILPASLTKTEDADASAQNNVEVSQQIDVIIDSTHLELDARTAHLADQFNKDEAEQRSKEVQFMEQTEGFDLFPTRIGMDTDHSLHADDARAFAAMSLDSRVLAAGDQALSERAVDQCVAANKDMICGPNQCENRMLDHDDTISRLDSSRLDGDLDQGNTIFVEKENVELPNVDPEFIVNPTTASNHSIFEDHVQDLETDKFEHDTDFLNFDDDDDVADGGDDSVPNAEEIDMHENVGWSARCRAVANYLQVLFRKEARQGREVVHLDNLLVGKSRKEASRMFFETLVLKTKDYIHVDQEEPFCNISVKPRPQLMKSEF